MLANSASQAGVPFPVLARFALTSGPFTAPGAPAPLFAGGLTENPAQQVYRFTMMAFTYIPPLVPIGLAVPPAIRATHVVLNGSPYAQEPIKTALWIASPFAARVGHEWQNLRQNGDGLGGGALFRAVFRPNLGPDMSVRGAVFGRR
jgi:hypothetical protein